MATTTIKPNGDGSAGSWGHIGGGGSNFWSTVDEGIGSSDDATSYVFENGSTQTSLFLTLEDTAVDFDDANSVTVTVRLQCTSVKAGKKQLYIQVFAADESTAITDEVLYDPIVGWSTVTHAHTITGTNTKASWDGARVRLRSTGTNGILSVSVVDVNLDYNEAASGTDIETTPAASGGRVVMPAIVFGTVVEQSPTAWHGRTFSVPLPPIETTPARADGRAITPGLTYDTIVETTPARAGGRLLSGESVVGFNGVAVYSGGRALSGSVSVGSSLAAPTAAGRGGVVMPSLIKGVRFFPAPQSGGGRAVMPGLTYDTIVETTPARAGGRLLSGEHTTPPVIHVDAAAVASAGRAVMPSISMGFKIALTPARSGAAAMSAEMNAGTVIQMPALRSGGRSVPARPPVVADPVPGPLLGGHRIISVEWISPTAIRVRFATSYGSAYRYQLYGGRCLIGVTNTTLNRAVVGLLLPSDYPVPLQLVAVDPGDAFTDFGASLPPRPYNRVVISFTADGFPADAKFVDVTGSTIPGGAVDDAHLIARIEYDGDRIYSVVSEPLGGSGLWSFEAFGRDDKLTTGNKGDALELSTTILAHPPDVVADDAGKRLTGSIAAQTLSVDFTYPEL